MQSSLQIDVAGGHSCRPRTTDDSMDHNFRQAFIRQAEGWVVKESDFKVTTGDMNPGSNVGGPELASSWSQLALLRPVWMEE